MANFKVFIKWRVYQNLLEGIVIKTLENYNANPKLSGGDNLIYLVIVFAPQLICSVEI